MPHPNDDRNERNQSCKISFQKVERNGIPDVKSDGSDKTESWRERLIEIAIRVD